MMQVNNDIWKKIYSVITEKKCTNIELNMIIQKWDKLLNQRTNEIQNYSELRHTILNKLRCLNEKAESGENGIIDQSINALSICSSVSDKDIRQLIEYAHNVLHNKIFISHSSQDEKYAEALVNFLEDIGLRADSIFCTSVAQYGVPLGEDFNIRIKEQFTQFDTFVIFLFSDNYYKSVACLNEMGAAWVLQKDYMSILLPGFEFKEIKGAINPTRIAIKMDEKEVKYRLKEFRDKMIDLFHLNSVEERKWNRCVENLLASINGK